MARATKAESAATAARVLDRATTLFAERGFSGVGLDEIAAAAGVTRGAVYHHYGSRLGVFRAVHARAQAEVAQAIIRATEALSDPWEALVVGCRAYLDAAVRDDIRQILLLDAPVVLGWQAWRELDAQNSGRLLAEALADLVRREVIRVDSVSACHALLSGAMNDAALWAASLDDATAGADEAWAVLTRMIDALRA